MAAYPCLCHGTGEQRNTRILTLTYVTLSARVSEASLLADTIGRSEKLDGKWKKRVNARGEKPESAIVVASSRVSCPRTPTHLFQHDHGSRTKRPQSHLSSTYDSTPISNVDVPTTAECRRSAHPPTHTRPQVHSQTFTHPQRARHSGLSGFGHSPPMMPIAMPRRRDAEKMASRRVRRVIVTR